jgi:hypothetical protein
LQPAAASGLNRADPQRRACARSCQACGSAPPPTLRGGTSRLAATSINGAIRAWGAKRSQVMRWAVSAVVLLG